MPIKRLAPRETAKDRIVKHRVMTAKKPTPQDRTTNYHEQLSALAQAVGITIDHLIEEWSERSAMREYCGNVTKAEAEEKAMDDVRERFGK